MGIDFFDIVSSASPQEALAIFRKYSHGRVGGPQELPSALRKAYSQLHEEQREEFLVDLAELHPDKKLFSELFQIDTPHSFNQRSCARCQSSEYAYANGQQAVNHYMSSGDGPTASNEQTSVLTREIESLKNNSKVKSEMEQKLFNIVLLVALGYLIYKFASK